MTAGRPPNEPKVAIAAAMTAREIIKAEKAAQDAKTARLHEARLAKEAAEAAKPPVKTVKKRRWTPK
jgi:hypothetical protein